VHSKRTAVTRRQEILNAVKRASLSDNSAVNFTSGSFDGPSFGAFFKLNFGNVFPSVLHNSSVSHTENKTDSFPPPPSSNETVPLKFIDPEYPFPCSYIVLVNDTEGGKLGQDCMARIQYDQQVIKMYPGRSTFGRNDSLVPGGFVTLKNGTIFRKDNYNSETSFGTVKIGRETSAPVAIQFQGPAIIDSCPDLRFQVIQGGNGGRNWASVNSTVFYEPATPANSTEFEEIISSIADRLKSNNATRFRVPANAVPTNTNFTLQFTFVSAFGDVNVRQYNFSKVSAGNVPVLSFDTPLNTVDFGKDFKLSAKVQPSACQGGRLERPSFMWSSANYTVDRNTSSGPEFKIPKGTLRPSSTYIFNVAVSSGNASTYDFTTSFTTNAEKVKLDISAPGVASTADNVKFNPVIRSNGPGNLLLSFTNLSIRPTEHSLHMDVFRRSNISCTLKLQNW